MKRLVFLLAAACGHPGPPAIRPLSTGAPVSVGACAADAADATDTELLHLLPTDKVASVTVHGASTEPGDVTLATQAGALFDLAALRADVHALWHHDVASRIAVTATQVPGGYAVAFDITPARRVIRVELEGVTRADVPPLAVLEGTLHDRGRLARLVASAKDTLRDHGYLHASLRATTRATCAGVIVRIAGALGRRFRIGTIRVIGAAAPVAPGDLERDLGHANVPGGAYWKSALDDALDRIVLRDRALGYFDAAGTVDLLRDERTGRVDVVLWITHGAHYSIRVVIEGGTPEMRALVAARVAPVQGTWDLQRLERALAPLAKQLELLGGVARFDDKLEDVYRVRLLLVPLAPTGEPDQMP